MADDSHRRSDVDEAHLARIKLVTQRYAELCGLIPAICGAGIVTVVSLATVIRGWPPTVGVELAIVAIIGPLTLWGADWIQKHDYPRRFGRVQPHGSSADGTVGRPLVRLSPTIHRWILLSTISATIWFDSRTLGNGWLGLFPLLVAVFGLRTVIQDWPFRNHHLFVVACGLTASLMFAETTRAREDEYYHAFFLLQGLSLLAAGVGDHLMLARVLDRRADATSVAHANAHTH